MRNVAFFTSLFSSIVHFFSDFFFELIFDDAVTTCEVILVFLEFVSVESLAYQEPIDDCGGVEDLLLSLAK